MPASAGLTQGLESARPACKGDAQPERLFRLPLLQVWTPAFAG